MKRQSDGTLELETGLLAGQEVARLRKQVDAMSKINAQQAATIRLLTAQVRAAKEQDDLTPVSAAENAAAYFRTHGSK